MELSITFLEKIVFSAPTRRDVAFIGESICLSVPFFWTESLLLNPALRVWTCGRDDGVCVSRLAREKLEGRRWQHAVSELMIFLFGL